MDIQGSVTPITTGQAAANVNSTANGTGSAVGGFDTALQTVMSGSSPESLQAAPIPSVLSLLQILMPTLNANQLPEEQLLEITNSQLDSLIALLEKADNSSEEELLDNPQLQSLLAQLQQMMPLLQPVQSEEGGALELAEIAVGEESLTEDGVTELNPMLFVPLDRSEGNEQIDTNSSQVLNKAEAVQLLKDFKELLHTASTGANAEVKQAVKQAVSQFSAIVMSLQPAESSNVDISLKEETTSKHEIHVTASAVQKLEYLAAKTVMPKFTTESVEQQEALFEPIVPLELDADAAPVPFQEFLKQVQSNQHNVRIPFVQMPASTFAEDMTQLVVSSFSIESSAEGFTEAKLSLYPQHLGHVEVKLTMQNGHLIAQFVADNAAGKEMLENQLSQLRTTLQNQGIQVDKLEVSQSFQSGMFQEQRQQQSQQSGKQQKSGNKNADNLETEGIEGSESGRTTTASMTTGAIDYTA